MIPGGPSTAPSSVGLAVNLMYGGAALAVLNLVLVPLQTDEVRKELKESSTGGVNIDALVATSIAIGIIVGLISVGLWIWLAMMNAKGRNWARITATVLGGLNLVFTPLGLVLGSSFGSAGTPLTIVLGIISICLAAAILILLWQPASSAYFSSRASMQQGYSPYG